MSTRHEILFNSGIFACRSARPDTGRMDSNTDLGFPDMHFHHPPTSSLLSAKPVGIVLVLHVVLGKRMHSEDLLY